MPAVRRRPPRRADGNLDSTIVEFTLAGLEVAQWDLRGKSDGLTADPLTGLVSVAGSAPTARSTSSACRAPIGDDGAQRLAALIKPIRDTLVASSAYGRPR